MWKLAYLFGCCSLLNGNVVAQDVAGNEATRHANSEDIETWQRANLLLSGIFWFVGKEGQVDIDSSIVYASRSLGLSRLPIVAEGIDDPELVSQAQWVDRRNPEIGRRALASATGRLQLEMLVLLGSYYAFEPLRGRNRDSAEYYLLQAIRQAHEQREDRLVRVAQCLLVKIYVQQNNLHHGDSVFNVLVKECEKARDKKTEARANEYSAVFAPLSPSTTAERISKLNKAATLYHDLHLVESELNPLMSVAYLHVTTGNLAASRLTALNALESAERIGFPYTHYISDLLAFAASGTGEFGQHFRYALMTIKTAENLRDSLGWGYFYGRLAWHYYVEGSKEKETEEWAKKALERFIVDRNPSLYNLLTISTTSLSSQVQWQETRDLVLNISKQIPPVSFTEKYFYDYALAECYVHLHQFDLAERHLIKADSMETLAEAFRGPLRRSLIHFLYGELHLKKGEYQKAKSFFTKAITKTSVAAIKVNTDLVGLRRLIMIDSLLGDYRAATKHLKQLGVVLEGNFRASALRQAEELQVLYQTQEKENQIAALNQRAELERANLRQAMLVRNLTIAGIFGALTIAGLLYRQARLRKRTNNLITQKNEQLIGFLNEKEWLLKEIHHRVKNNLQIVMSLLNSQSAYIDNELARAAIHHSQHRVHAMSLIHQKLYKADSLSSIDMSSYIRELVSYLSDCFGTGQRIRFEFDVEQLEFDVSQAVPLGLILNEAITNAIKYAFPGNREGVISISLSRPSPEHFLLSISDNGVGISPSLIGVKDGSLGMSLMEGLSEDIEGAFTIENRNGTVIRVAFAQNSDFRRPGSISNPSLSVQLT